MKLVVLVGLLLAASLVACGEGDPGRDSAHADEDAGPDAGPDSSVIWDCGWYRWCADGVVHQVYDSTPGCCSGDDCCSQLDGDQSFTHPCANGCATDTGACAGPCENEHDCGWQPDDLCAPPP